MKTVIADVDYLTGYLRYGHFELSLTDAEFEEFNKLSLEDKLQQIEEDGALVVDDFRVEDYGDLSDYKVYDS